MGEETVNELVVVAVLVVVWGCVRIGSMSSL
jgi:hypothetical protein